MSRNSPPCRRPELDVLAKRLAIPVARQPSLDRLFLIRPRTMTACPTRRSPVHRLGRARRECSISTTMCSTRSPVRRLLAGTHGLYAMSCRSARPPIWRLPLSCDERRRGDELRDYWIAAGNPADIVYGCATAPPPSPSLRTADGVQARQMTVSRRRRRWMATGDGAGGFGAA